MWGGLFLVFVVFWAVEAVVPLIYLITGVPFDSHSYFYPPDGRVRAIAVLSFVLLRTVLLWLYTNWAHRRNIFHIKFDSISLNSLAVMAIGIALALTYIIALRVIFHVEGAGVVLRWVRFEELYGPVIGPINTVLQYLYYAYEGLAMVWIVEAFQTAGEIRGGKTKFLWGTIALCLSWAIPHFITKGTFSVLYWALPFAVIFGVLYLASKKSFWPPFLFWMVYCLAVC